MKELRSEDNSLLAKNYDLYLSYKAARPERAEALMSFDHSVQGVLFL